MYSFWVSFTVSNIGIMAMVICTNKTSKWVYIVQGKKNLYSNLECIIEPFLIILQTSIPITATAAGVIVELFVEDGEKVEKGDKLLKIEVGGDYYL